MKNVERISGKPFWRVPVHGLRPTGWAVQYVSGMDGEDIKPGYWLSQWNVANDRMSVVVNFEAELVMTFGEESEATQASDALRQSEIETRVIHIV
jgi:hypothetical protein